MASKAERTAFLWSVQVLTFLFSIVFVSVIAYGYFNLSIKLGWFFAGIFALLLAALAWFLARVVGQSFGRGGRGYAILFAPLLIVSATGVYNSLMLFLEGGRIVADAANSSEDRFGQLSSAAQAGLSASGASLHLNRVNTLKEALFSEIQNPLNCGQGLEARRIMDNLIRELPGFQPLSNPVKDCSHNDEVIADYRQKIGQLIDRAPWAIPDLVVVVKSSDTAREALNEVRTAATTNYTPAILQSALNTLESEDTRYRDLRYKLSRQVSVKEIPDGLAIESVQSLGNAFKLPALFFDRISQVSTWGIPIDRR